MKRLALLGIAVVLAGCGSNAPEPGKTGPVKDPQFAGMKMPKKIGYVTNYATHEWYQNVIRHMKERAGQLGIELEIIDAQHDMAREVSAAEDLMAKGIDVLILTPVEQKGAEPILKKAKAENIPVVIEASAVRGMTTIVGIADYDAGFKGGVETGKYVNAHFGGTARVLAVDLPMIRPCVLRVDGFLDGIKSVVKSVPVVRRIDGQGMKDQALQAVTDALTADRSYNVLYGINDDSALAALQAYRAAKLDESKVVICGTGMEGMAVWNTLKEKGPFKVEVAMFPEKVGYECINMAVKLFNGQKPPLHFVTPTLALTVDNMDQFYTVKDGVRKVNWDAVNKVAVEGKPTKE